MCPDSGPWLRIQRLVFNGIAASRLYAWGSTPSFRVVIAVVVFAAPMTYCLTRTREHWGAAAADHVQIAVTLIEAVDIDTRQ